MTKTTKILLTISLTALLGGGTNLLWGFGLPIGAVFFGLFLISKVLEREAALFDEEHDARLALASPENSALRDRAPGLESRERFGAQVVAPHAR